MRVRIPRRRNPNNWTRFGYHGLGVCDKSVLVRLQVSCNSRVQVPVRRLEFIPVANRNCVVARRGGEHREANDRSETSVNSIRPDVVASLQATGEA